MLGLAVPNCFTIHRLVQSILLVLAVATHVSGVAPKIDADKAAELSREVREHFRASGINWITPRHLQSIDLTTNTKPLIYFFTRRSCSDCRRLMDGLKLRGKTVMSQLSAQFLAVLIIDDDMDSFGPEFNVNNLEPYVPRMLFASPQGKLNYNLINPTADKDQAFMYLKTEEVVDAMLTALDWYRPAEELQYATDLEFDMPS